MNVFIWPHTSFVGGLRGKSMTYPSPCLVTARSPLFVSNTSVGFKFSNRHYIHIAHSLASWWIRFALCACSCGCTDWLYIEEGRELLKKMPVQHGGFSVCVFLCVPKKVNNYKLLINVDAAVHAGSVCVCVHVCPPYSCAWTALLQRPAWHDHKDSLQWSAWTIEGETLLLAVTSHWHI